MSIRVLVIAGTLAPSQSEKVYYHTLLTALREVTSNVEFSVIPRLGLGNIVDASEQIAANYLCDANDKYIFIGHSQGGIVASLLGMQYSSQTLAVICLATPLGGTFWTDPVALPFRAMGELATLVSAGRLKLRLRIPNVSLPFNIPVVSDLSRHSEVLEQIAYHLTHQVLTYTTYSIIGTKDMLVLPRRSAYLVASNLEHYLVLPKELHIRLAIGLPEDISVLYSRVGHIGIVHNPIVLELVKALIQKYTA